MKRCLTLCFAVLAMAGPHGAGAQTNLDNPPALFATIASDREKIYQHELFHLTLSIYSSGVELAREVAVSSLPDRTSLELGDFQELPDSRKAIAGRLYTVRRFVAAAACPMPGTLAPKLDLHGTAVVLYRSFFFTQKQEQPVAIPLQPLLLSVRPLPETGKPADFSGGVGQFNMDVGVEPLDVAIGDLITITTVIRGTGNVDRVAPPTVSCDGDFKLYEPRVMPAESSKGKRVFQQIAIPLSANARAISSVAFAYFDPHVDAYRTNIKGPFAISLHAPLAAPAPAPVVIARASGAGQSGPALRPEPRHWQRLDEKPWYRRNFFLALQLIPPACFLIVLFVTYRRRNPAKRSASSPIEIADETITYLRHMDDAINRQDERQFFEALSKALEIANAQTTHGSPLAFRILELLATCERLRYGGASAHASSASSGRFTEMRGLADTAPAHRRVGRKALVSRIALLACLAVLSLPLLSNPTRADIDPAVMRVNLLFKEAATAYGKGDTATTIAKYSEILQDGFTSTELLCNLGAAYLRDGRPGYAIVYYGSAWAQASCDAAAESGLNLALQRAQTAVQDTSWLLQALRCFSRQQWIVIGVIAYWLVFATAAALAVSKRHRWVWTVITLALVGLVGMSLAGAASLRILRRHNDVVVVRPNVEARLAPNLESRVVAEFTDGAVLRIMEQSGDWALVSRGQQTGWLPMESVEQVFGEPTAR